MKAVVVIVYPIGLWWVKLHNRFLLVPEQVFNEAHFFPMRASAASRDRYVLPRNSFVRISGRSDYEKILAFWAGDQE
jgi:hypothetical protein